jgi:PleD family two-component response regulator
LLSRRHRDSDSSGYKLSDDEEIRQALQEEAKEEQEGRTCACNPILIAEDDPFSLMCMNTQLESLHLKADSAMNGKVAVEMFQQSLNCHPYQVIFMDVNMPLMNGLDASRAINTEIETYNKS